MSDKLKSKDLAAVVRTTELIEQDGWSEDKRLADMIRSWMRNKV